MMNAQMSAWIRRDLAAFAQAYKVIGEAEVNHIRKPCETFSLDDWAVWVRLKNLHERFFYTAPAPSFIPPEEVAPPAPVDEIGAAFNALSFSFAALQLLAATLGDRALAVRLALVVAPVSYEAHGAAPNALVEIHQNRALTARGKWGWAIRCARGALRNPYTDELVDVSVHERRFLGGWTEDIVVASKDLMRIIGAVHGVAAPVLGNPDWIFCPEFAPARVYRTPKAWLAAGGDGVVLFGAEAEQQNWLRGCTAGVVADDLAHGEALVRAARREAAGPKVLVAA